jgi:hypothetical protein
MIIWLNTDSHCKIKCSRNGHSCITNLTVQGPKVLGAMGKVGKDGELGEGGGEGGDAYAWKTAATVVRFIY